jgi:hypothetical protein
MNAAPNSTSISGMAARAVGDGGALGSGSAIATGRYVPASLYTHSSDFNPIENAFIKLKGLVAQSAKKLEVDLRVNVTALTITPGKDFRTPTSKLMASPALRVVLMSDRLGHGAFRKPGARSFSEHLPQSCGVQRRLRHKLISKTGGFGGTSRLSSGAEFAPNYRLRETQ